MYKKTLLCSTTFHSSIPTLLRIKTNFIRRTLVCVPFSANFSPLRLLDIYAVKAPLANRGRGLAASSLAQNAQEQLDTLLC